MIVPVAALARRAGAAALRRGPPRAAAAAAALRAGAASALRPLSHLAHLQGRPPTVDAAAGTFASFYYKNIREHDTPTKDHIVAFGQDERFTVGAFDVRRSAERFCAGLATSAGARRAKDDAAQRGAARRGAARQGAARRRRRHWQHARFRLLGRGREPLATAICRPILSDRVMATNRSSPLPPRSSPPLLLSGKCTRTRWACWTASACARAARWRCG